MSEEKKHEEHKHHEHHKHEGKHVYMEHHEHKKHQAYKISTWILAGVSIVLLIGLIIVLAIGVGPSGNDGGSSSVSEVKTSVEKYIQGISDNSATVDSIVEENGLYHVKLTVAGKQYDSYATRNGKLLFPQGIDLTQPVPAAGNNAAAPSQNIPKTDKPVVELFVMSHCPYGTQAEKGILPAVRALGDTVDFKIRWVYYAMHGEKEVKEQLVQHCIQTEQNDKYLKYLACFLNDSAGQGNADASNACIKSSGVDTTALESCKTKTDVEFKIFDNLKDRTTWLNGNFPKFDIDLELNTKYSIGGSPTLVINGVQSNAGRDAASYLSAICASFTNAPSECDAEVSSTQPGPGFGYDSVGAANAAGCGV